MLIIRNEQMAAFRGSLEDSFSRNLAAFLTAEHPQESAELGEAGVLALVEKAVETGRTHGVVHQGGIAVLAELMIRFGTEFSRSPDKAWAWKMLAKPSLPGEVKVAALRERMEAATGGRRIVAAASRRS